MQSMRNGYSVFADLPIATEFDGEYVKDIPSGMTGEEQKHWYC